MLQTPHRDGAVGSGAMGCAFILPAAPSEWSWGSSLPATAGGMSAGPALTPFPWPWQEDVAS